MRGASHQKRQDIEFLDGRVNWHHWLSSKMYEEGASSGGASVSWGKNSKRQVPESNSLNTERETGRKRGQKPPKEEFSLKLIKVRFVKQSSSPCL